MKEANGGVHSEEKTTSVENKPSPPEGEVEASTSDLLNQTYGLQAENSREDEQDEDGVPEPEAGINVTTVSEACERPASVNRITSRVRQILCCGSEIFPSRCGSGSDLGSYVGITLPNLIFKISLKNYSL